MIAREDITRDPMIVDRVPTEQCIAMLVAISDYSAVAPACECTYNEVLAVNDRAGLLQICAILLQIRSFAMICAEVASGPELCWFVVQVRTAVRATAMDCIGQESPGSASSSQVDIQFLRVPPWTVLPG